MKRLRRQDIIYRNQLYLFTLLVGVLLFFDFISSYSFIFAPRIPRYKDSLIASTKQEKKSKFFLNTFPSSGVILPTLTPTPTANPQRLVQIPVVNAETNRPDDYCLDVPVLLYHHIEPLELAQNAGHAQLTVDSNYFDMQISYLAANNYHALSSEELIEALRQHRALPTKSILITIDDGYADNYEYAYRILKKYNMAGNFMISSGLIENSGYMTWEQLREMGNDSLMHIYNHTWSHASLGGEARAKIEYEIATANKQIKDNLGKDVNVFTYPYGSFSPLVIDVLKEQGFIGAFSTIGGIRQCESYIFALRRIHIGNAPLTSYGF